MTDLQARFDRTLARLDLAPGPVWVAVSGGADSVALLHLLVRSVAAERLRLVVAHVDHGIHADSAAVAAQVAALAESFGLPLRSTRLALGPDASETRAREARYRWLLQGAGAEGALLLTAHNRDDQVETVLMRFLEGSGLAGLAGMSPAASHLAEGTAGAPIVRPLLGFGRLELRDWLAGEGVTVWEDPSNLDPRHLRGWLRGSLLPLAEARDPAVRDRILRVAEAAQLNRAGWDRLLGVLPLDVRLVSDGISVASVPLRDYDFPLALSLVMAVARRVGLSLGPERAGRVVALLRHGRIGARIELGGRWFAERNRDRLALVPQIGVAPETALAGPAGDRLWGPWRLRWAPDRAPATLRRDGWSTWAVPGDYQVTGWSPGDRIRPLGGTGSRLVVRCMQELGVPRHQRAGWPVLRLGGEVIWVPGVCRSGAGLPGNGMEGTRIDVEHT